MIPPNTAYAFQTLLQKNMDGTDIPVDEVRSLWHGILSEFNALHGALDAIVKVANISRRLAVAIEDESPDVADAFHAALDALQHFEADDPTSAAA